MGQLDNGELAMVRQVGQVTGGFGHLGEVHFAVMRFDGLQARAMNFMPMQFALGGVGEDFAKALAAVGERGFVGVGVGKGLTNGSGGGVAGGGRAERMFEFVEGEEDAHGEGRMLNSEF